MGARGAGAFSITPVFDDGAGQTWDANEEAVVQSAIDDWTSRLAIPASSGAPQSTTMVFEFVHGDGELASWTGNAVSSPTGSYITTPGIDHVVDINVDLMDPNLTNHLVFTLGDVPFVDWDALSVLRHEIGHAMGFNTSYDDSNGSEWLQHITINGNSAVFDQGGMNLQLEGADNLVHVAGTGLPGDDLMSPFLPNSVRRDISTQDLQALALAYGYVIVPEPGTALLLAIPGAVW